MISLYPCKHISFESEYTISEAVSRLSDKVKKNIFGALFQGGIIGKVNHEFIVVRNSRFWLPNSIVFKGSFSSKNKRTFLSGKFETTKSTHILMNFGLTCLILSLLFPFVYRNSVSLYEFLMIPLVILLVWLANYLIYIRLWRTDIQYISQTINDALL